MEGARLEGPPIIELARTRPLARTGQQEPFFATCFVETIRRGGGGTFLKLLRSDPRSVSCRPVRLGRADGQKKMVFEIGGSRPVGECQGRQGGLIFLMVLGPRLVAERGRGAQEPVFFLSISWST